MMTFEEGAIWEGPPKSPLRGWVCSTSCLSGDNTGVYLCKSDFKLSTILLKLFQKIEEFNSFYEATITLIPNLGKDITKQTNK